MNGAFKSDAEGEASSARKGGKGEAVMQAEAPAGRDRGAFCLMACPNRDDKERLQESDGISGPCLRCQHSPQPDHR